MSADTYIVYVHTNKTNGKRYVGVSKTTLRRRAGKTGGKYWQCKYFANAIAKYGWDGFDHEILHEGLSKEAASFLENYYVTAWDLTNRDKGYNIQPGGLHSGGMSEEGFANFIAASRQANMKPVVSFDLDGHRLKEFDCIQSAAAFYGVSDSGIEASLFAENHTCQKKLFRFLTDFPSGDMTEEYLNSKVRVRHYKSGAPWNTTPIVLFDKKGDFFREFSSVNEAADFLGIYHGTVSGALNQRHPTAGGYYVRRKSDVGEAKSIPIDGLYNLRNIGVSQLNSVGECIGHYGSLREAAKAIHGDHKAIKDAAIDGRVYRGFYWKLGK